MPFNICPTCIQQAQTAYAYKKKCEESDIKLRKYYTKVKIKQEHHQQEEIDIDDANGNQYDDDEHFSGGDMSQEDGDGDDRMAGDECLDIKPVVSVTVNVDPLYAQVKKLRKKIEKTIAKSSKKAIPKRSSRRTQGKKTPIIDYDSDNEDDDPTFSAKVAIKYDYDADENDDQEEEEQEDDDDDPNEDELAAKCQEIDGRIICHICEKSLGDRRTLKLHLRLHTGKHLKKCKTCGRGFAKKSHLDRHMMSHIKKEYKCEYCPEKFDNMQDRRAHVADHMGK